MENYISLFIIIPLVGFLINAVIPNKDEVRLSQIAYIMAGLQFVAVLGFTIHWLIYGAETIYKNQLILLELDEFDVPINFIFDSTHSPDILGQNTYVYFLFIGWDHTCYNQDTFHC